MIPDKEWDLLGAHFGSEKESLKGMRTQGDHLGAAGGTGVWVRTCHIVISLANVLLKQRTQTAGPSLPGCAIIAVVICQVSSRNPSSVSEDLFS